MENTATLLKLEVEDEIRAGFKPSSPSSLEPLEDTETSSEAEGCLHCESANSGETGPFAAADKRLFSLEEKLDFSKVLLMVKCFQKVAATRAAAEHVGVGAFSCNALFCLQKDEQWRGEALREKLQHREDRLKVTHLFPSHRDSLGSLWKVTQTPQEPGGSFSSSVRYD